MRWIWIDKFIEFDSGRRARAIKNITLAEDHLHDHFPGYPVMPNSLIVEGLAQTGGLLVGEVNQFQEKVILAKIPRVEFFFPAVPGDQLTYTATIEHLDENGGRVTATSHVGDRLQAEAEIVFVHLRDGERNKRLFEPKNFVFTMKLLGVFDVGRSRDGGRIAEPPGLAQIKAASNESGLLG
ncbi:MAG TPA: 3-hydroxyacyl-ACP dehydratase FabZ family protein [Pirellulales bacterium]|jgi:3-hydroxyacyl-[acyl-carrier-protein] dehydratase|nr:3-hydroxyacyl-ACP dehydratase FabZ family protein [Pirellulales bacterium]